LVALSEAQIYLYKDKGNVADLNAVQSMLQSHLAHQWDYVSEVGFYNLYYDYLKQKKVSDERLKDYLDRDPQLTSDHRHNVFVYRGRAQWKILGRLCEQMTEQLGESARVSALQAMCYAHEGRWDLARRHIETAAHRAPKDALVQALYSYILKG